MNRFFFVGCPRADGVLQRKAKGRCGECPYKVKTWARLCPVGVDANTCGRRQEIDAVPADLKAEKCDNENNECCAYLSRILQAEVYVNKIHE